MKVSINGKVLSLPASKIIGEGGEAEIYDIGGGKVAKIFKTASHLSFRDSRDSQEAARRKIDEHQKKLPSFPKNLPGRIVGPSELVIDPQSGKIMGFTMPYLTGYESLLALSQRSFREASFNDERVVSAFSDLHQTVDLSHKGGLIFGDFNDLNGLVKPDGSEVWMLDIDSAQFGGFLCKLYTTKFVDPVLSKLNHEGNAPTLAKPHNEFSDWYAFALMLMQSWLYVGPFGGVYCPKEKTKRIPHEVRPLKRVTVWDSEVIYPKPGRPLSALPSDVCGYFESVFRHDKREKFPTNLLESLNRKAKGLIPEKVGPIQPGLTFEQVKGMKAERIFQTSGSIIYATRQNGKLLWLYGQDNTLLREDGKKVIDGVRQREMRFRISGEKTVIARDRSVVIVSPDGTKEQHTTDAVSGRPMVDANGENVFVIPQGELSRLKSTKFGTSKDSLAKFIENQTMFWVGDDLGFGFYRAGGLCMYFIFNPKGSEVNDTVALPPIKGQLIDATVAFGNGRVWFFLSTQENGQRINRCHVIDGKGSILGSAETTEGDGSWLSSIRGKSAMGKYLFVATDDGIVRVELDGNTPVITKTFPETTKFVDSGSMIIVHRGGIGVVGSREIWNLTIA